MSVDWDRRRLNVRILMAAKGTNATRVAEAVGLSPNTLSQFTNGRSKTLSPKSLSLILPELGLAAVEDLDTDTPLANPKASIRRLLDQIPEEELPGLLDDLKKRFPKVDA